MNRDLDDAIRKSVNKDMPGTVVSGWALVIATELSDGSTAYGLLTAETAREHETIGLLNTGLGFIERKNILAALGEPDQ